MAQSLPDHLPIAQHSLLGPPCSTDLSAYSCAFLGGGGRYSASLSEPEAVRGSSRIYALSPSLMHSEHMYCDLLCVGPYAGQCWGHSDDSEMNSELTGSQTWGWGGYRPVS